MVISTAALISALAAGAAIAGGSEASKGIGKQRFDTRTNLIVQELRNSDKTGILSNMTDMELAALVKENYMGGNYDPGFFTIGGSKDTAGAYEGWKNRALDDLSRLSGSRDDINWAAPPSYADIMTGAQTETDALLQSLLASYDSTQDTLRDSYSDQMSDMNNAYNDYAGSVQSNDYRNNAMLMGTMQSDMKKARMNALEAGASAGVRLASNINTMLSAQNQQAQQSLATSNNLAQMLLNQRQAAAGIRGDYRSDMSYYDNQKETAKQDNLGRAEALANTRFQTATNKYNNDSTIQEDKFNSKYGSNPFAAQALNKLRSQY